MKRPVPQFYVVGYREVRGEAKQAWCSHRIPGVGMAYFGFSSRGLADAFAATADLENPEAKAAGKRKWVTTFLAYPELRRRLERGLADEQMRVNLLAIDPKGFDDLFIEAAHSTAVIDALARNTGAESGVEVQFDSYANLPSKPRPEPMEQLRRMPVGEACLIPIHKPPAPAQTAWVLRRSDAQIAPIRRHPESKNCQRATMWSYKFLATGLEVRVVALAIALGFEPFAPETISAAFINEYDPACKGMLENLTIQARTPILVVGDTEPADFIAEGENTLRQFAQSALARIASLPPWSRSDFARCVDMFKQNYPTKLALWEHLAKSPYPRPQGPAPSHGGDE